MEFRIWRLGLAVILAVPGVAGATLINRGSGLIYDSTLDITWLQDANYAKTSGYDSDGRMNWPAAESWAANLVYGGFSDWRLPTMVDTGVPGCNYVAYTGTDCRWNVQTGSAATTVYSEMASLFYDTLLNLGYCTTGGSCPQTGWGLTNTGPFANVQSDVYWSGLEYAPVYSYAWVFDFGYGNQDPGDKGSEFFAWAVRPGDVAARVPEPGTLLLLGAGLIGVVGRRRARR